MFGFKPFAHTIQTFVKNSVLFTDLEFNSTVKYFVCPLASQYYGKILFESNKMFEKGANCSRTNFVEFFHRSTINVVMKVNSVDLEGGWLLLTQNSSFACNLSENGPKSRLAPLLWLTTRVWQFWMHQWWWQSFGDIVTATRGRHEKI